MTSVSSRTGRAGKKFGGGLAARRVHPHVERTVEAKREAARWHRRSAARRFRDRTSTPSTCASASAARTSGSSENHARRKTKRGSRRRARRRRRRRQDRGRRRRGGPSAPRRCEDRARMPAAAERRVDVDAGRLDRQRRHGFFEQDGDMGAIGHQREKPASSGGSPSAGNAMACAVCDLPLRLVPELELAALPDEHDALVEAGIAAQRRRHQDASRAHPSRRRRRDRPAGAAAPRIWASNEESAMSRAWIGSHASRGYSRRQREGSAVRTRLPDPSGAERLAMTAPGWQGGPWRRARAR